jgi:hypothetical protein
MQIFQPSPPKKNWNYKVVNEVQWEKAQIKFWDAPTVDENKSMSRFRTQPSSL